MTEQTFFTMELLESCRALRAAMRGGPPTPVEAVTGAVIVPLHTSPAHALDDLAAQP
jgi:hypothetical protein